VAVPFQVTFDCADAERMMAFWSLALDYIPQPPPEGFDSWEAFVATIGMPYDPTAIGAVVDPSGAGPRLLFQRVPEHKQVKNRVHLDVNAGGPRGTPDDERRARVDAKVKQLVEAGASVQREAEEHGEHWVVLTDPEGNEFCVQ
jgi:hypothetical protein